MVHNVESHLTNRTRADDLGCHASENRIPILSPRGLYYVRGFRHLCSTNVRTRHSTLLFLNPDSNVCVYVSSLIVQLRAPILLVVVLLLCTHTKHTSAHAMLLLSNNNPQNWRNRRISFISRNSSRNAVGHGVFNSIPFCHQFDWSTVCLTVPLRVPSCCMGISVDLPLWPKRLFVEILLNLIEQYLLQSKEIASIICYKIKRGANCKRQT